MRHHSRVAGLVLALSVASSGCKSTQTDQFTAKTKSRSETATPTAPRRTSDHTPPAGLQTETFEAKPKSQPARSGPGPNVNVVRLPESTRQQMEVHFIQVGQGDATLLKLPNGKNILVDAGSLLEREPQALKTYIEDHLDNAS